jgi:streptomycin 3"-adenylyltransferase
MPVEAKRDIISLLLRTSLAPCPIEISFLVEQQMHPFQHPLPYDLHYSEAHRERYTRELADGTWRTWNDETKHDYDLAAHLTITRARGIRLCGRPPREVLPAVPPEYYADAIIGDFEDALQEREQMPVYFVLNACRVLAFLRQGLILSKDEGGSWGLQALPEEQHAIVAWALDAYRGESESTTIDHTELDGFSRHMEREIRTRPAGAA